MMNQQPDKLFQEKLAGFSKTVPASAWNRIETNLDKKNSKGLWLKVAASLLVLAVAAFLLWSKRTSKESLQLAQHTEQQPSNKKEGVGPVDATTKEMKSEQPLILPAEEVSEKEDGKVRDRSNAPVTKRITSATKSPAVDFTTGETKPEVVNTEINQENNKLKPETIVPEEQIMIAEITETPRTAPANDDTGITLIYTVDEVNEKYLDKKSLAEATSDEKKASTLRKLLDKAKDLKHNQDPFGELRQKKNEILAFNFKSDKQRSQNK